MSRHQSAQPALFLDRDGVINVDKRYVHQIEQFEFVSGIFDLCATASARGYLLIVATNQSGIARGLFTEADLGELTGWMTARFRDRGIPLSAVYHCPHHPHAGTGQFTRSCECRKPKPGMLLQAARDWCIDLEQSILIGDNESDMLAATNAGIGTRVLLSNALPRGRRYADFEVSTLEQARARLFPANS